MASPTASIWRTKPSIAMLMPLNKGTLGEVTGMEFTDVGDDYLQMSMPVDERTKQPAGLLHGGASAALAETIGSVASNCIIDRDSQAAVGIELNCSHLRGVRSGRVIATCRPIRIGSSLHVWNIEIADAGERLVCVCRLTVSVINRRK